MVLSLESPTDLNFIKDFPGMNATNLDDIDSFATACLTTHPQRSFSPGLISSTGNNPVLGTGGFNKGYYYQIWDQLYLWGEFRFGTAGINVGGDIYIVTLPFTINTPFVQASTVIGAASLCGVGLTHDASANAGRLPLTVHLRTQSQLMFGVRMNSGLSNRELRSAGYITWDINDGVSWSARFQQVPS